MAGSTHSGSIRPGSTRTGKTGAGSGRTRSAREGGRSARKVHPSSAQNKNTHGKSRRRTSGDSVPSDKPQTNTQRGSKAKARTKANKKVRVVSPHSPTPPSSNPSPTPTPAGAENSAPTKAMFATKLRYLAISALLTVFVMLIGSLLWREAEGGSFLDALYHAVVTMLTIGYGDVTPEEDSGRLVVLFYICIGMAVVGYAISYMSDLCAYSVQAITTRVSLDSAFLGSTDAYVEFRHSDARTETVFSSLNPVFDAEKVYKIDAEPLWRNPERMLHVGEYVSTSSELSYSSVSTLSSSAEAELVKQMSAPKDEVGHSELRAFRRTRRHALARRIFGEASSGEPVPVLHLTVMDEDRWTRDDLIGAVQIPLGSIRRHWKTFTRPIIPDNHQLDGELLEELIRMSHLVVQARWGSTHSRKQLLVRIIGAKALPIMDRVHFHKVLSSALDYTKEAVLASVLLAAVLILGAVMFMLAEDWTFMEALYMAMITGTTVGLGDFSPQTKTGRALFIPYAFVSVSVAAYTISVIQHLVTASAFRKSVEAKAGTHESLGTGNAHDSVSYSIRLSTAALQASRMGVVARSVQTQIRRIPKVARQFAFLLIALAVLLAGGAAYIAPEEGWTWFEGVYALYLISSTVGFGDFVPTKTRTRIFCMAYSVLGLALMTTAVSLMASVSVGRAAESASNVVNNKIRRWRTSRTLNHGAVQSLMAAHNSNPDKVAIDQIVATLDDLVEDHNWAEGEDEEEEADRSSSGPEAGPVAGAPTGGGFLEVFAKNMARLGVSLGIVVVLCCLGGFVILMLEERKYVPNYFIAVYFVAGALSTVGYGDVLLYATSARVFLLVYLTFGLGLFAYAVTTLQKTTIHGFDRAFTTVFLRYQKWQYAVEVREQYLAESAAEAGTVHYAMANDVDDGDGDGDGGGRGVGGGSFDDYDDDDDDDDDDPYFGQPV